METLRALNQPGHRFARATLVRWVAILAFALTHASVTAADESIEPAQVKVSGFGFFGNREMTRLLRNFQVTDEMPVIIDRTFVEDAALVLLARAMDEGYLRAALAAEFQFLDGTRQQFLWTNALEVTLPREFAARGARFKLQPGQRYYYDTLEFTGLAAISARDAASYFVSGDVLLQLRRNRIYNPGALRGSLAALQEAYARIGYRDATVTTNRVTLNHETGAVAVEVVVQEGLPSIVRSVDVTIAETAATPAREQHLTPNVRYTQLWQQDLAQSLRTEQFQRGYPDTTVEFAVAARDTNENRILIDLTGRVQPGPLIHLGEVHFRGNQRTKTAVLASRMKLEPGEPLDRVEAEASRQRLARLGVFNSVALTYSATTNGTRDVTYEFQEIKPISLSLIGGFGSYELLRGGLEFQHRNVLGQAHSLRLRGLQSFKASKGDASYTIPEIFGENVNLFLQADGQRREEVSFTREEYGGSVGIQKRLIPIQTDFALRYDYEFLNAQDVITTATNLPGVEEAKSAAFVIELNHDGRDHPLLPRRGLKLYGRAEFASAAFGGTVDYQRFLLGASYHHDLHGGRILHLGVTHGVSFTWGGTSADLPFNKRYFPGGENSIRGYQEGEASPLDVNGGQLGAETYSQANLEFEQLLTKSWSVVLFFDAVGFAQDRNDYPWNEGLYSAGGGLRWRTLIGPVRLEYGHNLNRRIHDPAGTLHFSIGFPF